MSQNFYWLIEREDIDGNLTATYFKEPGHFTSDAWEAMRFSCEAEAKLFIIDHGMQKVRGVLHGFAY